MVGKFNFYRESKKYMKGSVPLWQFYLRLPGAYMRFKKLSRNDSSPTGEGGA